MLLIYPSAQKTEDATPKAPAGRALPEDWPFMEQSGTVLESLHDTWKPYPANESGMLGIIGMEYNELQQAVAQKKGRAEKMRELVHLASACLHYWRHLNHAE